MPLNRGGYVTKVTAGLSMLDGDLQTLLRHTRQPPRLRAHLAYRDSAAHVGPKPIQDQAQIEADYVAVLDLSLARNTVDGLVVDGNADRLRKAVVAQEAWPRACRADAALGQAVKLDRAQSFSARQFELIDDSRQELAGPGHHVDLVLRLEVDHLLSSLSLEESFPPGSAATRIPAAGLALEGRTARRIRCQTSSMLPVPSMSFTTCC